MKITWTDSRRTDAPKDMKLSLSAEGLELVLGLDDSQIEVYGGTIDEAREYMRAQLELSKPADHFGPSRAQKRDAADRKKFDKRVTTPIWNGCQVGRATMRRE